MTSVPASCDRARRGVLLTLRVAAGTGLFVLVLIAVQSGDRRVAGMMLTFPALNGLSLMLAPNPQKRAMAAAMLPVIGLNGLLAMAFIAAAEAIGPDRVDAGTATMLVGIGVALWLVAALGLSRLSQAGQWRLVAVYVAVSVVLVAVWWGACPPSGAASQGGVLAVLTQQAARIGLFAACLGGLLVFADAAGAQHGWIGRLGAFPLLPLFSLAIMAQAEVPMGGGRGLADLRAPILAGMLLAMSFAWIYAGVLERIDRRFQSERARAAARAMGLLAGWGVCGGIVAATMRLAAVLEGCAAG